MILSVANQKGGVGKTTTAYTIAYSLGLSGKKVLLVDSDPQCNATDTAQVQIDGVETLYDLLTAASPIEECIQHAKVIDVIAGDPLLRDADKLLDSLSGVHRLSEALNRVRSAYDTIVVDTPPGLGVLLTGALTASDAVLIPMTADRFALQGMAQLVRSINDVRKYSNQKLRVAGIVLTMYSDRTTLSKDIASSLPRLAEDLNTSVLRTRIRSSVKAREAQAARQSVLEWAPKSTVASDYRELVAELQKLEVL